MYIEKGIKNFLRLVHVMVMGSLLPRIFNVKLFYNFGQTLQWNIKTSEMIGLSGTLFVGYVILCIVAVDHKLINCSIIFSVLYHSL